MINEIYSVLNSIHFETELLESLEWDEEELNKTVKKLTEYLSVCTKNDLDLVKADLGFIFSENICIVIFKYIDVLKDDILNNNTRGNDNEA